MPYQTGTASSFANLKSTIETFLTGTPGYTLTGSVLTKTGTQIHAEFASATDNLFLDIGKSSTGSTLENKHPDLSGVTQRVFMCTTYMGTAISWNVNYYLQYFSSPVEFFHCVIEYEDGHTQNIGFGEIEKATAMDGGVYADGSGSPSYISITNNLGSLGLTWTEHTVGGERNFFSPLPFGRGRSVARVNNTASTYIWAEVQGFDWFGGFVADYSALTGTKYVRGAANADSRPFDASSFSDLEAARSLYQFNANNALVPIRLMCIGGNGNTFRLGGLDALRWTNIKHLDFGEIKDDGTDEWKCYPAFYKNSDSLNGTSSHSGQIGYAIKYDGP